jgi:hypothetical protein
VALLVDLDKYKEAIGETDDANDNFHTEAIEDASAAVLNFTDRDFASDPVTEARTYNVPSSGFIIDIDDATEVLDVDGLGSANWRAGNDGPATMHGIYTYIEYAFRHSLLMGFTRNEDVFGGNPFETVTVTADYGWPEVPDDVQRATILTAQSFEGDRSNPSGALASKSVAEVAENYLQQQQYQSAVDDNEPLPARARSLLLPYRRVSL